MVSGTNTGLRRFSKLTSFATLFLIFAGGMVTSTGSGLAVPDWPLSYGTLFPPMVGGVFYEHGHRMVAAGVGLLVLCLTIWLALSEERRWVRALGFFALAVVVFQGILGGMTVLFFLPAPLSVSHAVLAQTFLVLIILIAYSQSKERRLRELDPVRDSVSNGVNSKTLKCSLLLSIFVYVQLLLGALMRHSGSGLMIHTPLFSIHLLGAALIVAGMGTLHAACVKIYKKESPVLSALVLLELLIFVQLLLGIFTVLTHGSPSVSSFHVVTGAAALGVTVLLILRIAPLSLQKTKRALLIR